MDKTFLKDMLDGLAKSPKVLSSKYFYDEVGDTIFQEIMEMEEYYLPKSELEIIKTRSTAIAAAILAQEIDVIELGAGDGSKTVHLLSGLIDAGKKVTYIPLDISAHVLRMNEKHIAAKLPNLEIEPIAGDYFATMEALKLRSKPKLILFLGSNIGNFKDGLATEFIQLVRSYMSEGDFMLLGADLKKNPKTILAAYNDKQGITKRFNLNLLERMNRDLGANFDTKQFDHYPFYDPESGSCYSYLVSISDQKVNIGDAIIAFNKNECIHTEVSQKYSLEDLEKLSRESGFSSFEYFLDDKQWFSLGLMAY